jgi:gas vesicle protein
MNNTTKVILGVAAGAVAGAITGLLLAPEDGVKTRRKINKESEKLRNSITEAVIESLDSAKGKYNSLMDEYTRSGRKSISKAKKEMKDMKSQATS